MPRIASFASLCALVLLLPLAAAGERPDWDAFTDVGTIHVLTQDEDGDARETTIWLAVLDGQGFIRTGGSSWGKNVARDANLVLRIEGVEYPLRAEFIEDEALRARVTEVFREKYGWTDVLITPIRGANPSIMHLLPR